MLFSMSRYAMLEKLPSQSLGCEVQDLIYGERDMEKEALISERHPVSVGRIQ